MSRITILYGTETGNSEMAADDIAEALGDAGVDVDIVAMDEYKVADLANETVVVLITSTYGEGELPETTAPFHGALTEAEPDLSGLRFAAFGLGDSTFETYNNAIVTLVRAATELGATQIGETGKHDAASGRSITDVSGSWVKQILEYV
ncbi:flavodoxin domain-containing protein [Nocardia jiangxiensis]|uniref:Flavodoxin domain-containing protein n=1 Tax=Nocardia jiangxiensis TaxID=282685 RepID=A0ABW6SAN7_9NOCA|nr:flavodoxin family protein [Nocardia jiangxiensis]